MMVSNEYVCYAIRKLLNTDVPITDYTPGPGGLDSYLLETGYNVSSSYYSQESYDYYSSLPGSIVPTLSTIIKDANDVEDTMMTMIYDSSVSDEPIAQILDFPYSLVTPELVTQIKDFANDTPHPFIAILPRTASAMIDDPFIGTHRWYNIGPNSKLLVSHHTNSLDKSLFKLGTDFGTLDAPFVGRTSDVITKGKLCHTINKLMNQDLDDIFSAPTSGDVTIILPSLPTPSQPPPSPTPSCPLPATPNPYTPPHNSLAPQTPQVFSQPPPVVVASAPPTLPPPPTIIPSVKSVPIPKTGKNPHITRTVTPSTLHAALTSTTTPTKVIVKLAPQPPTSNKIGKGKSTRKN